METRALTFKHYLDNTGSESVDLSIDELPIVKDDVNKFLDVMTGNKVPAMIVHDVALEYYRINQSDNFQLTLEHLRDQIDKSQEHGGSSYANRDDLMEIYQRLMANSLSQYMNIERNNNKTQRKEYGEQFVNFTQQSNRLAGSSDPPYITVMKGFYEFNTGKPERAARHFNLIANTPGYAYIYNVGYGCIRYQAKSYQAALDHFMKALKAKPDADAGIRVAIGACAFKLGQYERCSLALKRALSLDPCNVDALILMALTRRVEAMKDKVLRKEYRLDAHDLCKLADYIGDRTMAANNLIANHIFHTWKLIDTNGEVQDDLNSIIVQGNNTEIKAGTDNKAGDDIQIDRLYTISVDEVQVDGDHTILHLEESNEELKEYLRNNKHVKIEAKLLQKVQSIATHCAKESQNDGSKSESFYILGRLYHHQGNYKFAEKLYKKAVSLNKDMVLANFGLGQILFARGDFEAAIGSFETALKKYPDDHDCQAFIILAKALHRNERVSFEKIREVSQGFPYEVDLWLLQAQIRIQLGVEYQIALKCYDMAIKCCNRDDNVNVDPNIFANMAILHHSLGSLQKAKTYSEKALDMTFDDVEENPTFMCTENDIYFQWSPVFAKAQAIGDSKESFTITVENSEYQLTEGDQIMIEDVIAEVVSINGNRIETNCLFSMKKDVDYNVKKKMPRFNFNKHTLLISYNHARILEDMGSSRAAMEIYNKLLIKHPAFMECYLRLSCIAKDLGKFTDAGEWLEKALHINDAEPDVNISLGDLCARRDDWDKAKHLYEKINSKYVAENQQDARTMISQGNLYYKSLSDKQNFEKNLKRTYKFYHNVLAKNPKNAYATNGIGMICAEMNRFDAARELFSRARESNINAAGDISLNLAHTHLFQGKNNDALRMYQSTINIATTSAKAPARYLSLLEGVCFAHFRNKQYNEAMKSLLRVLRHDPTVPHVWYNLAFVLQQSANQMISTQVKNSIENSIGNYNLAQVIFKFLSTVDGPGIIKTVHRIRYDKEKCTKYAKLCDENVRKAREKLDEAAEVQRALDSKRKEQESERQLLIAEKRKKKQEKLDEIEREKTEKRQRAEEMAQRLESLKQSWATVPRAPKEGTGKSSSNGNDASSEGAGPGGSALPDFGVLDSDDDSDVDAENKDKNMTTTVNNNQDDNNDNAMTVESGDVIENDASKMDDDAAIFGSDDED